MALKLREAPDLGAVDPEVGFDVGGRLADGGEVDAEQLGAALQRSRDRPGEGGIVGRVKVGSWASQVCMPSRLGEQTFGEQWK